MANPAEKRIYALSGLCALLVPACFVVPRFFPNPEGAFASGANAILALLGMLLATLVAALGTLVVTLHSGDKVSIAARVAGIAPSVLVGLALIAFFGLLAY